MTKRKKPKAWLRVNWEVAERLRSGDYVRYKGRWLEVFHILDEHGILLSNFKWVCRTELG